MSNPITLPPQRILLADDDDDDCFLFKYALEDLPLSFTLTLAHNGEDLMQLLNKKPGELPDVLFMDLNMPRLNGIECLQKIKNDPKLTQLPVIIFSTFISPAVVTDLYKMGAQYCIRKPTEVPQLKEVIWQALTLIAKQDVLDTEVKKFGLLQEFYHNENK